MDETSTRSWVRGILPGVHDWIIDLITEEFEREYARNKEYKDKALSFDLDQAGIRQREKEAVELVELRARLVEMEKNYQQLMHYSREQELQLIIFHIRKAAKAHRQYASNLLADTSQNKPSADKWQEVAHVLEDMALQIEEKKHRR